MKLFCELTEEVKYLVEENEGKKNYFIEGVFLQADIPNRNKRIYNLDILENEVNRYNKEYVKENRAFGELGHPSGPTINLERVCIMTKNIRKEGSNFIGKAKVMDTPYGNIVKNLINEGAKLGVSSRGMGSLRMNKNGINEVQNDFFLATAADVVADPSAPDAFVRGIMEGLDVWYNPSNREWMVGVAEQTKKTISKMTNKQLEEKRLFLFQNYLNELVKK